MPPMKITRDSFADIKIALRELCPGLRSAHADEAGEGQAPVTEPSIEILPSIDPTSDVELVFKTLYTTYTYFTTFFRESTSKVKSREEVISNVITLTNILKSTEVTGTDCLL